jgi:hypothetical protein
VIARPGSPQLIEFPDVNQELSRRREAGIIIVHRFPRRINLHAPKTVHGQAVPLRPLRKRSK